MFRRFSRVHPVEWGIWIIISLIVLSVLVMCVLQLYTMIFYRRYSRISQKLKELFLQIINTNALIPKETFEPYMAFLPIVVTCIREFNEKIKGDIWDQTKKMLIRELLQARISNYLRSWRWKKKSWALQALALSPDEKDEPLVLKYLKSKVPVVRYSAAACAVQLDSQVVINAVIEEMSREDSYARFPFRDLLINRGIKTFQYIKNNLKEQTDPAQRICCLEILSQKAGVVDVDLIHSDLESDNQELKWWAVRSLENCPSEGVLDILSKHCEEGEEQVRAIAVRCLGGMLDRKAIALLDRLLKDPMQLVKLEAALALRKMKPEGIDLLKMQPNDGEGYQIAQYVLSLPEGSLRFEPIKWYRYY